MTADNRSGHKDEHVAVVDTKEGSTPSKNTRNSEPLKTGNPIPTLTTAPDMPKTLNSMDGTTQRKRKNILPSYDYRQLFQSPNRAKLSDSAEVRRQGRPCTNSDSVGTKKIYVTEDTDLHEQSTCVKDCAERTSQFDQGGLNIDLKESASGTPELLNTGESHPRQKLASSSVEDLEKIQKKKDLHNKLSTLPFGCDTSDMDFVNKLCDFWSKGQNALINDEQVQVSHIIRFMSTLLSNVSRPFLVIAPSSSLSKWQAEFTIVASSINVVVYNGNRNAREMIRTLEFFEDGHRAKFEVLLSTLDIITEDLEFIKCIRWETVIMDACIKSDILAEPLFLKKLALGSMILIWMYQINENTIGYCNKLSLLKCSYDVEGHQVAASNSSISLLREELSPFIVSGPRSVSSKLVEYWVPVQMSNLQLEQYCSSILTNLTALCSKNDPVGILNEILITAKKSCDHPYTVDPTLPTHLIELLKPGCSKGVHTDPETLLAIGVPASGKLYLLDAILPKMKDQGQRVIILFKGFLLGDILEDFVRLTFGEDSYERVDGGGVPSHKQASVTKFNKEKGRFIFLLEIGACSSSIKVSSVDAVVMFSSDWNPFNDIKALQKIKMDSESDIKVFRLYTMCTIEEKALLLSTRNILVESKLQSINSNTCHRLLTWGASYLFRKLDEFHDCDGCLELCSQNSEMKDVLQELTSLLMMHDPGTSMKFISSAWQNGASYSKDVSLLGEQYSHLTDGESACIFWKKLLDARQPRWRLLPSPSRRKRKQVKYYDGSSETNVQPNEAIKRQKMGNTNGESLSPRFCKEVGKEAGMILGVFPPACLLDSHSTH